MILSVSVSAYLNAFRIKYVSLFVNEYSFQTFMNWRVPVSRSTTSMSSEFQFYRFGVLPNFVFSTTLDSEFLSYL